MSDNKGQQMRITPAEIEILRGTFKDNEPLLKLLRKIFLPELDPTAPIGQMVDLWFAMSPADMQGEDALINLKARNNLIAHVEQQLMQLKYLSELPVESPMADEIRREKDSTK